MRASFKDSKCFSLLDGSFVLLSGVPEPYISGINANALATLGSLESILLYREAMTSVTLADLYLYVLYLYFGVFFFQ